MEKLTCEQAKKIDLIDYLALLGHTPEKIRNSDYWYLSPLRDERTASFKVDRKLNVWYDHAEGVGGDLIDFGTRYFKCSVRDLLQNLSQHKDQPFSFHQHLLANNSHCTLHSFAGEKKEIEGKIVISETRQLTDKSLLRYLELRNISLNIANNFCREIDFLLYGKQYRAIGFQNNSGGYELRSADFKGSSSPKGVTFLNNNDTQITVFEGFFNFLAFQSIASKKGDKLTNLLVLNSLSFFERSRPLMEKYEKINLYLDRDKAGVKCTQQALTWDERKYKDQSSLYQDYKDLNDWSMDSSLKRKPGQRLKGLF